MGMMTTVMILNDAWHSARRDPKSFIDAIDTAMNRVTSEKPLGFSLNPHGFSVGISGGFAVMSCQHADTTTLLAVGGNYATVLGHQGLRNHHKPEDREAILRELADSMGFRIVRKSKSPK